MSDLKDCEIERLSRLFASGSMQHAPEIARLLGQELNDQGPKPIRCVQHSEVFSGEAET